VSGDFASQSAGTNVALIRPERRISVPRLRKSEIELLWVQLEELIEHGKNKDEKRKLQLMQRVYRLLAKTMPKNKPTKKR
jgi:hypothetical protein